jgi:carboxymethylenebutenolidase
MAERIELNIGARRASALVALPSGAAPVGGVVVGSHHWGLDAFTAEIVDRLAASGLAAICPDHYYVLPEGVGHERRKEFLTDRQLANDMDAAGTWLESHAHVDAGKLAIIGHCMGGRTALATITALPDRFCCSCIWYSGSIFSPLGDGPAPGDRLEAIETPLMGFFGSLDKHPSPAEVQRLDAGLTKFDKDHEFHMYDGADHSFMWKDGQRYNEVAATDSWERASRFLHSRLS